MIRDDDEIKKFLERRRAVIAETDRLEAVYLKRFRQEREARRTKAEKFLDDFAFHTGLDLTVPANMSQALDACAEYLARQQAKEDKEMFSPTLDKGGLTNGF